MIRTKPVLCQVTNGSRAKNAAMVMARHMRLASFDRQIHLGAAGIAGDQAEFQADHLFEAAWARRGRWCPRRWRCSAAALWLADVVERF